MNHPYLYPDEAPWTDDYHELLEIRWHRAFSSIDAYLNANNDETHAPDCSLVSAATSAGE